METDDVHTNGTEIVSAKGMYADSARRRLATLIGQTHGLFLS